MVPRFLSLLLLAFALAGCGVRRPVPSSPRYAFAEKFELPGVSDTGKVNDFLYRGTQPSHEGVEQLKKLGITTIVDLRGERRGTMEEERRHAESVGMRLVLIPGNGWSPPRDEQIAQFLSLFRQRPKPKVFVHCWLGSDRSGVFIATYRMAYDGWTPEQALAEMRAFHFKGFWHPAMKAYIRDFPARLQRSPALTAFRVSSRPTAERP